MTKARDLSQIPNASLGMKNRIINGDCRIDQRNAGASVTPTNGQYLLDRWRCLQSTASKYSVQQDAGGVTPPVGFSDYLGCTSLSSYSVSSSDYFVVEQMIEGFNFADMAWGTANAATVTLSFWVRSSLTGTFGGAFRNSAGNRSYPFTYTISAANTWEQKSITVAGDTTGTWVGATNGSGCEVKFGLGVGSTLSGTAGAWAGSNFVSATGATSVVGTSGATFYITGVQLEKGSTATSFDYRPYGTELALCQRYYWKHTGTSVNFHVIANGGWSASTTRVNSAMIRLPVTMRASPTSTYSGGGFYDGNSVVAASGSYLYTAYTPNSFSFDLGSSTLVASRPCSYGLTNTNEYIDFSAEL
jgi:hypothetical protein